MYTNPQFYQGYPQSQAPNTSGMNASPAPIPDHTQLSLPQPGTMAGSFDPTLGQQYPNGKPKRKQVKNACTNCQKACKKCDDQRPCPRCVKYGQTETCVDSVRKERQKGIKRGPYKKRKQGDGVESNNNTGIPNPMYPPPPTTGDNRAAMAYQAYASAAGAQFENFPGFQNGHHYQLPYNILNNMSTLIQQAAASASSANANGGTKDQQQQQGMDGGNKNNNINNNMINKTTEVDEHGKLNILSQLCTAVLDHDPNAAAAAKNGASEENKDSKDQVTNVKDEPSKSAAAAPSDANVSQSTAHSRDSTTTDNNNESGAAISTESTTVSSNTAPAATGKEADSEDDRGSRYGTPEDGEDDADKNN